MKKIASGYRLIFGYLGIFLVLIGLIVISPLIILIFYPAESGVAVNFYSVGLASIGVGVLLSFILLKGRDKKRLGKYQDFLLISLIWIAAILIGSMPFLFRGDMNFTNSVFEATSGFTTTGLSVFDFTLDPDVYGYHIYTLYRSLLIFFGGVGLVLVLVSALSDRYGMRLYSSEGHNDRLLPNLAKSSRFILSIYSGIIFIGAVAYTISGMNFFDAINHSIAAVGTGGFSTNPNGILFVGGNATAIEIISIFLMMAGATNFMIHLFIIQGKFKKVFRDLEVRFILMMLFIFIPLFTLAIYYGNGLGGLGQISFYDSLRLGAFYMVSSITTTGFNSFQPIAILGPAIILMSSCLMLIGGAAGSSAGGIKLSRVFIVLKEMYYTLFDRVSSKRVIKPRFYFRYGEEKELDNDIFKESASYLLIYILALFVGALLITMFPASVSFQDAIFESSSALATTGLSVGVTHATQHPGVLWVLTVLMLFGRLEIMTVYYAFLRLGRDVLRKETI
jgi:trk system potassium uptake protein TrkH